MTETTVTVTLSIGRNVGDTPMDDERWDAFRDGVRTLLLDVVDGTLHVNAARSEGQWLGVFEESSTFVAEVPQSLLTVLRLGVANLRNWYEQDAIAVTLGKTELV